MMVLTSTRSRQWVTTLAVIVVGMGAMYVLNPMTDPMVGMLPLVALAGAATIRKYPAKSAAALPMVSIALDGLLVELHLQTALRFSTLTLLVLLSSVLVRKTTMDPQLTVLVGWITALLVVNYVIIALPTGRQIPYLLLAIMLEGFALSAIVASLAPNPTHVLIAVGCAGLWVAYFCYFPLNPGNGRPIALGLDSNYLGAILAAGGVAFLTLARVRRNWLIALLAIPTVFGMVQVQSRSSVFAAAVGVVAVISLSSSRRNGLLFLFGVITIVAAAHLADFSPGYGPFTSRRIDTRESSDVRQKIRDANIKALKDNPLEGVGLGVGGGLTSDALNTSASGAAVAHNEYLRFGSESGVPALLGLLTLVGVPAFIGVFGRDRIGPAAYMWPPLSTILVSMLFLNILDNAQMATLTMTMAGMSWSGISLQFTRFRFHRRSPSEHE